MAEYIPTWRRAVRKKPHRIPRPLVGWASVPALALLWVPLSLIGTPISIQLARGDKTAWTLFALIGLVISILAFMLAKAERVVSTIFLTAVLITLGYISVSDPYSVNHLFAFIVLTVATCVWMFWIAHDFEDWWLKLFAAVGVVAVGVAFLSLGIGERVLMTGALSFICRLYYEHLHPPH